MNRLIRRFYPDGLGLRGIAVVAITPPAIVLAALISLSACATGTTPVATAQTTVASVAIALTAADQIALKYATLPACKPSQAKWSCADPTTVAQMKADALSAYNAVKAAEKDVTLLAAAQAAVAALTADLPPS